MFRPGHPTWRTALRAALTLALPLAVALAPAPARAGSFLSDTYNGRAYKLYVPTGYKSGTPAPLVVMLHGCTQDPTGFATSTEMNTYAEQYGFLVAYPQQTASLACWQWFDVNHQVRGKGEPADIAGITAKVKGGYTVDRSRVYVAGFSAGAAMAVIMGATYPDVYAAIGVASGLEYKAATSSAGSSSAMSGGGPSPDQQGKLAYDAMGSYKRVVPTLVFHGTSDYTVAVVNGHQVLDQWAQTDDLASDGADNNNIDNTADETTKATVTGGRTYTRYVYEDTAGTPVLEKYIVDGMGHAWSGGSSSGAYTDPKGPKASQILWDFFISRSLGGEDLTAPVTSASPKGGSYSSAVSVTLSTNEPATTFYTTNGSTPTTASAKYSAPITIGSSATLKFFSVDPAGNQETVKSESYTIGGTGGDTTPPVTTATPGSTTFTSSITVTLSTNESAATYFTVDGSAPTTASSRYTAPLVFTKTTTLRYFSVDAAGNQEAAKSATYTLSGQTVRTFKSVGTEDGYAGALTADGYSATVSKAGDKGMYNVDTYRTILSFDTSAIPDGASIQSVKLRIFRKSLSGAVTTLTVDIKNGAFGSSSALVQSDYSAAASASGVGQVTPPSANNQAAEATLSSSANAYVNKTGKTQLRLKAATTSNTISDVITLYGGEDTTYAPELIVTSSQ